MVLNHRNDQFKIRRSTSKFLVQETIMYAKDVYCLYTNSVFACLHKEHEKWKKKTKEKNDFFYHITGRRDSPPCRAGYGAGWRSGVLVYYYPSSFLKRKIFFESWRLLLSLLMHNKGREGVGRSSSKAPCSKPVIH